MKPGLRTETEIQQKQSRKKLGRANEQIGWLWEKEGKKYVQKVASKPLVFMVIIFLFLLIYLWKNHHYLVCLLFNGGTGSRKFKTGVQIPRKTGENGVRRMLNWSSKLISFPGIMMTENDHLKKEKWWHWGRGKGSNHFWFVSRNPYSSIVEELE
jgi:hypothetical protein